MPSLTRISISGLRNIAETSLEPGSSFNLIHGENGSGKTSLLEAIYLLGMGRSFRTHLQSPLISHDQQVATVFGQTAEGLTIGVQKQVRGPQSIKIGGTPAEGLAQLTRALPLQLVNSNTFLLLEGSPSERRHFLDWGVFHVEHQYLEYWRRARSALQQRNMLLRREAGAAEIEPWTYELAINAEHMDKYRREYVHQLTTLMESGLFEFGSSATQKVQIDYWPGWELQTELVQQLQDSLPKDRKYGHTTTGPHKADLHFTINDRAARDVLSRGQLKSLICALKVLQAQHLIERSGVRCLFLLDDLPAELDTENRDKVCKLLSSLRTQVFMTSVEADSLLSIATNQARTNGLDLALFHVKHGKIDPVYAQGMAT